MVSEPSVPGCAVLISLYPVDGPGARGIGGTM